MPRWQQKLSRARLAAEATAFAAAIGLTIWSAILVKQARTAPPLAGVYRESDDSVPIEFEPALPASEASEPPHPVSHARFEDSEPVSSVIPAVLSPIAGPADALVEDASIRWFNGRPVRPVKTMRMRVTAYSPDARSCGDSADGLTATLHSVETNNFELVAADPRLLPYGSMLSVPGYAGGRIVPVLDCGGKIKGNRLDVLYRTHDRAKRWGSQWHTVTVWAYADGKPSDNPRKLR